MHLEIIIKRYILLIAITLVCSCNGISIDAKDAEEERYPDLKEWFDYLCSPELGGRYSGSEGIKKAVVYISNIIGQSDSLIIDTFSTDKCEMRNLIYHIKGVSDSIIVIGAHYDAYGYRNNTPLPGADDNLSGTAVLLSIIQKIKKTGIHPKYSIEICFFDGEEIGQYGSRHYLTQYQSGIKEYINVDTCGNKDFGAGFYYDKTHPYLRGVFENLISFIPLIKLKVAEYNPKGYTTDCEPFEINNIPFVSLMNDAPNNYQHSFEDNVSHISFEKIDILAKGLVFYLESLL